MPPLDDTDTPDFYARNQRYVQPGKHVYNTPLQPRDEQQFRQWLTQNRVPFDPSAPVSDYDMRGFWSALRAGDPKAASAVDPNDQRLHYPDYWKTPYHQTFSNESQWATPQAPHWTDDDKLVAPDGTVVFDDRVPSRASGGAAVRRGYEPENEEFDETLNRGWHEYMTGARTGDQSVDTRMRSKPGDTADDMEISTGKFSKLGGRRDWDPEPQGLADGGTAAQLDTLDNIPGTPLTNTQAVGTLPMAPTEDQAPLPPVQRDPAVAAPAPAKPAITLDSIRQKYPQYSDLSDQQLAQGLHRKFYDDMPFEEFAGKIGYQQQPGLLQRAGRAIGRAATAAMPSGQFDPEMAKRGEAIDRIGAAMREAFQNAPDPFPPDTALAHAMPKVAEWINRIGGTALGDVNALWSGAIQTAYETAKQFGMPETAARDIAANVENLGLTGAPHVPGGGDYAKTAGELREEAMNPAGWINRDWEGNREPWHDYQPPRLALPSPEGKRAAPGSRGPTPQEDSSVPRPEAAAPPATEKPAAPQGPQRWEDVALQELEPHEQTETAKGAVKDFAEAARSEGVELPTVTVTARRPEAAPEAPAPTTETTTPPSDDLNYETTQGEMGIRKRRLQTYTLEANPRSNRIMVRDDHADGQVAGSGYATVDDAVRAFEPQDMQRIGVPLTARAPVAPATAPERPAPAPAAAPEAPDTDGMGRRVGSWVVVSKETKEPVLETFNKKVADAVNREKYDVLPAYDYLSGLNKKAPPAAPPDLSQMSQTAETPEKPAKSPEINQTEAETGVTPISRNVGSTPFVMVRPDQLTLDPERFQYKASDARGVTGALGGIKRWEPDLANPITAWEGPDGRLYVVNGHQRTDLAQRAQAAGQEVQVPTRVFRAADGYTPDYMRALGAYQNIAEGTGTAIDAAKVLRGQGAIPADRALPELPPRSQLVQQAHGLAALDDRAFGMVENGTVSPAYAAFVGESLHDPAEQIAALDTLARAQPANAEQARIMVEDIRNSGFLAGAQTTLFGDEAFAASLFPERARILDNAVRTLRRARGVFKAAIEGEQTLSAAGNELSREGNLAGKGENEALIDRLRDDATRRGPLSNALSEAARGLASGKPVTAVTGRFLADARRLERSGADEGVRSGAAIRGTEPPAPETLGPGLAFGRRLPRPQVGGAPLLGEAPSAPREERPAEPTVRNDPRQLNILGTDASARQAQAARDAQGNLRGKGQQQLADEGLFAPKKPDQGGLFGRRAPLYSAVARAVDTLKQARGTGSQMLAQITKTPGVKPEEVRWLGLADWLNPQKSVTREQIAEYVRANALDVQEVTKGAPTEAPDLAAKRSRFQELADRDEGRGAPLTDAESAESMELMEELGHHSNPWLSTPKPRYESYTLPGGENYRELLLTLPVDTAADFKVRSDRIAALDQQLRDINQRKMNVSTAPELEELNRQARNTLTQMELVRSERNTRGAYQSAHWDEPNVLAHIRFNERTAPDGKRVLLVEEVQSDWHQQGRKHGYQTEAPAPRFTIIDNNGHQRGDFATQQEAMEFRRNPPPAMESLIGRTNPIRSVGGIPKGVPDAPFKTTWPQLAMKRVIKWAADNGFDRVAWVPGDVQAARYDLSKQISALDYQRNADGTFKLSFQKDHRGHMIGEAIAPEKLEDHVGKDVAQKIIDGAGDKQNFAANNEPRNEWNRLSGLDLKVGGEGMRGFYDKMLPNEVQKIVGKFGAKVGKSDVRTQLADRDKVAPDETAERDHGYQWKELTTQIQDIRAQIERTRNYPPSQERSEALSRLGTTERNLGTQMDDLHARMVDETMARGTPQPVHSVDLTPALRQAVQIEGLPLFKRDRTHGTGQLPSQEAVHAAADAIHRMLGGRARVEVHEAGDGGFEITDDGQTFTADGYAVGRLMRVALSPDKTFHYLNHEALHVLRNMGVFTPAEWRSLEQAAIREGWGKTYDTDRIYADLNPEQRLEEAIAERFADLATNPRGATPLLMRLLNKLRQWFERFRNLLAGNGLRSAEDVFGKAMRGDVGAREPGSGMPERGHTDFTEAAREAGTFHPAMQFGRREQVVAKLRQTLGMEVAKPEFDVLRDKKGIANAIAGIKAGFAPTALRGAKPMEYALRQHNANVAQSYDQAVHALEKVRRATDSLSKEAQIAFTDLIEKGERQPTPGLQAVADALRGQLDKEMRATQALGKGYLANAIENYMGHIWGNYHEWAANQGETPPTQGQMEQAARAMTGAKRPLEGKASFLKKRYFPTQLEGIEAGLIPVTFNPVDLQLIKIYEMQKFRHAVTLAEQMKDQGIARWVKNNPADEKDAQIAGLVKLDDKIFKPKFFSEAIQTPSRGIGDNQGPDASTMPGWVEPGSYWAPEPMARVFNNYMGQGWHGKSSLYDGFRAMNNGLNSLQLGLSGFHAMFVALDTALSKSALGLQQMTRGNILRGAASVAETPIAPITTFLKGKAATKAWLEPENATPEMRKIIDAMKAGGARLSMPEFYRTSASGAFFRHWGDLKHPQSVLYDVAQMWRDTPGWMGKAVMVPLRFVGRALDTIQQPLMGFLVPRMKMGVFADLAQDWLRDHPTASAAEVSAAMTRFQDSVDNRLGQLNYDNLFWDKRLKDTAFITTRSVGWNLGTIRELAGAVPDTAAFFRDIADGKKPEVTTRMAYAIMLPIVTAIVGATFTYLATGEGPKHTDQDLWGGVPLDLFYPRTGGTLPNGEPERVSIPGYMKDVVAAIFDPIQTARNKIAPLWATLDEMVVQNRDYYRGIIYDRERDSSAPAAYADYLLNQNAPFSVRARNRLAGEGASWEQQVGAFLGWQPAPGSITNPERGEAFRLRDNAKAYRQRLKEPGRIQFFNAPRAP